MSKESRVEVSRRIEAPASRIFDIVATPQRHVDFDGSDMLRGSDIDHPLSAVGETFTMEMHRMGRDYLMINHVVELEPGRRFFWAPSPGDASSAPDDDPTKIGLPAGYRWGFVLTPDGDAATVVTEVFDPGPLPDLLADDGGKWINGSTTVRESMAATLARIEQLATA